ncbi:hypothetical protein WOLCODRAFT_166548 [Wolfiporia cocos MD-104 SS10]|uniref:Uncharacterized protein n=1 Tax=Wolfiporia cocos (strain MD-104) TaxID=742152 RepID=A0A2H3JB05_WOLCO|nr:hypothetical protein WOLCODRAFT_166548 [Wolfiporia cocos MD-104 SS10]
MDAAATAASVQPSAPAPAAPTDGPAPMSFPAILRTPGLSDRFAHLRPAVGNKVAVPAVPKRNGRDDKEGKRWVRRKESDVGAVPRRNGVETPLRRSQFVGNAHIVPPTKRDYALPLPAKTPTFPVLLLPYIPRSVPIPPSAPPTREPSSAAAGPRTEALVRDVESALLAWLADDVLLVPDDAALLAFPGAPLGETGVVGEVQRAPLGLVWSVHDDGFARYVVHCGARFHGVARMIRCTASRTSSARTSPGIRAPPPRSAPRRARARHVASDAYLSSDAGSERDPDETLRLQAIAEASAPRSPALAARVLSDDEWSVVDADA